MSSSITHTGAGQVSNTNGLGYFFSFATLNREDMQVEVIDPSNTRTPKTVTTEYTIENYLEAGSSNSHIKFVSETARGFTNSQSNVNSYKVRIFRRTPVTAKVSFVAGSSITASDLNTQSKQALHLSEENRDAVNSLATGDATVALQVTNQQITNNAVSTVKIQDNAITSDKILNGSITSDKILDGAVVNADINTSAAIDGTKVNPNFGSQNISTTGTLGSGNVTISSTQPQVIFTDTDENSDFRIRVTGGQFEVTDTTNNQLRLKVESDGTTTIAQNLNAAAGLDVTGNLTISSGDIATNANDIYLENGTIISADAAGAFSDRSGANIDHIWHNDTNSASNTGWNFVSDGTYKQTGNAEIHTGSIRCYSQDAMMLSNAEDRNISDNDMNSPLDFDTIDLQKGGINVNSNRDKITVSQDGIYLVTCCLSGSVNTHSHGDGIAICLRKNGAIFPRESAFPVESFGSQDDMEWAFTFAITEIFSANDYLEVVFRNIDVTVQATLNKGYLCVTRLH